MLLAWLHRNDRAEMSFWIAALLLVLASVLAALWPLLRRRDEAGALDRAVAFYEARAAELQRQRAAGEITPSECEAALAEQGRLLIAAGRETGAPDHTASATGRRKLAALGMIVLVPLVAAGIYLRLGAPLLPDLPLVSRNTAPQALDVADAVRRIEAHLARNPEDGRGFEVVAPVYLKAGRFEDAAHAYRRVIALLGESPSRLGDLGESLVAAGNGVIAAEARQAFERALALEPGFAKARFYLALAREQDGDAAGAFAALRELEASLPEGSARERVASEIERFRAEGKIAQSEAGRAIASLPEADRNAAIRGMVEALDARLAAGNGSREEWRRLVQARIVLGEPDLARAALKRARAALAADAEAAPMLDALEAALPGKAP